MIFKAPYLYRAQSNRYLKGQAGIFLNPNILRARRPRDMPMHVHNAINDWFIESFNIGYRGDALFCTGDRSVAAGYVTKDSTLIAIAPLGDYTVCYSAKCKDLFGYYQFYWSSPEATLEKIKADLESLDFVHEKNGDLTAAAVSGNEVMIVAERFQYCLV
ncbi:hypothetical protein E2K99_05760 [Herbaspirillum huttiense]|uniref:hypothetical protein n=1 Tax=Herbaspirillum huttiense TaxID=863372 RepID=UPI0010670014|nr:hypothetical protein [Herbaspirillum huttiense]QBP74550.1 hypothetical protein E2K99_05760 [Herbaspirillum huttiense]